MKKSQRLQQLDRLVCKQYNHIWDCCCDHGFLGLKLLERQAASQIHFVDINEQLMVDLQSKLELHYASDPYIDRWQTHCMDTAHLPLNGVPSEGDADCHLIIIAGVGGERLTKLVKSILFAHPGMALEFLLCPVHHNYKVRKAIAELGLGLITEHLLLENGRYYELIHVSTASKQPIAAIGSSMWDLNRDQDRVYLEKTIAHYQRMLKSGTLDIDQIIIDYQTLQTRS